MRALIGREIRDNRNGPPVTLDFSKASVELFLGNRGYGKTYGAAARIEEQLKTNATQSLLVLDSMGIYSGLKYPNDNPKELEQWKVVTKGFPEKVKVLVPIGDASIAPYADGVFSLSPGQLDPAVWFDIFGLTGVDAQSNIFYQLYDREQKRPRSLDQMLKVLGQMLDEGAGHPSTIRAVEAKLQAAKRWKFFDTDGQLNDFIKPDQCTVLDLKFANEYIRRAIASFLLKEILRIRIQDISLLHNARLQGNKLVEPRIPPTTVLIEEAHQYQNMQALKDYVRMGRSPGCSLIMVSQEPETLDTTILRQPDRVFVFRLTHKDAIRNILKIVSSPPEYFKVRVRQLDPGQCYFFEHRSTQARFLKIRPRHSAHIAGSEVSQDIKTSYDPLVPAQKDTLRLLKQLEQELQRLQRENTALKNEIKSLEVVNNVRNGS